MLLAGLIKERPTEKALNEGWVIKDGAGEELMQTQCELLHPGSFSTPVHLSSLCISLSNSAMENTGVQLERERGRPSGGF